MVTLSAATKIIQDYATSCPLPLALERSTARRFEMHDYFFVADAEMRCVKQKGRWRVSDREAHSVAQHLAGLKVDSGDLVDVHAPPDGSAGHPYDGVPFDWRGYLLGQLESMALHERGTRECPCGARCRLPGLDRNGLPCGLSTEAFHRRRQDVVVAATRPFEAMTWSDKRRAWRIPRGYAAVLDRWAEQDAQRAYEAMSCTDCGRHSREWSSKRFLDPWALRVSSTEGWVMLCPACTSARYRPYDGQLHGRRYSTLPDSYRAEDWLCELCEEPRRAAYWDHCHGHDLVRGPLCANCNTREGNGEDFVSRPGHLAYLLTCPRCLQERTLQDHHVRNLVRAWLRANPGDVPCRRQPWPEGPAREEDGALWFTLRCCEDHSRWEREVPASKVRELVRAAIERHLPGHQNP